jgi:ribosomal protein L11 methyltransferase
VLDVGTGTGVLAIAAALAARVHVSGTDVDPAALRAAKANAALNHAASLMDIRSAKDRGRGRYDLVLANILASPLIRLAPRLARQLAPHGRIILSGLMPEHAAGVISAYRDRGLALERRIHLEGWVTLTMRRGR